MAIFAAEEGYHDSTIEGLCEAAPSTTGGWAKNVSDNFIYGLPRWMIHLRLRSYYIFYHCPENTVNTGGDIYLSHRLQGHGGVQQPFIPHERHLLQAPRARPVHVHSAK